MNDHITKTVTLSGPPVTLEMQMIFGFYGQATVTGVVVLKDGLHVAYENGLVLTFIPTYPGTVQ